MEASAASAVGFAETYTVKGTVMQVRPESLSVEVAHETIPGFMPAMTMPFQVRDANEIEPLQKGSCVRLSYVVSNDGS